MKIFKLPLEIPAGLRNSRCIYEGMCLVAARSESEAILVANKNTTDEFGSPVLMPKLTADYKVPRVITSYVVIE